MYTSGSKFNIETGSRSPKNQLSKNSSPRSHYLSPDSRSTSSQFSQGQSYDVSLKTICSIINRLKQQNQHLSGQKQKINKQMQELDSSTNILVRQNQELRNHYQQRTIDVGQIVKSMIVNTKLNMQDTEHSVHLFQGQNSLLAKKINQLNQRDKQTQININRLEKELNDLNIQNVTKQNHIKKVQAKLLQITEKVRKQKSNKTILDLQNLQKQICSLTIQTHHTKIQNILLVNMLKNKRYQIQYEKPALKNGALSAINKINPLKQQVQLIKYDYTKQQHRKQELNARNSAIIWRIRSAQRQNEQKSLKLQQLMEKLRMTQKKKNISIQGIRKYNDTRTDKIEVKNRLEKQLLLIKENRQKTTMAYQMKRKQIQKHTDDKINELRQKSEQMSKKLNDQLMNNIIPTKNKNNETISTLRYQHDKLKQKIIQLQNSIKSKPSKVMYKNTQDINKNFN